MIEISQAGGIVIVILEHLCLSWKMGTFDWCYEERETDRCWNHLLELATGSWPPVQFQGTVTASSSLVPQDLLVKTGVYLHCEYWELCLHDLHPHDQDSHCEDKQQTTPHQQGPQPRYCLWLLLLLCSKQTLSCLPNSLKVKLWGSKFLCNFNVTKIC